MPRQPREHKCPFCDEVFTEPKAMLDHIREEHRTIDDV